MTKITREAVETSELFEKFEELGYTYEKLQSIGGESPENVFTTMEFLDDQYRGTRASKFKLREVFVDVYGGYTEEEFLNGQEGEEPLTKENRGEWYEIYEHGVVTWGL